MTGIAAIRKRTVWHVQGCLLLIQIFLEHEPQLVPQLSFDPSSVEQAAHRSCKFWDEHGFARLNSQNVDFILAHVCGMLGVMVKPLSNSHEDAELGISAVQIFPKGNRVEHYYGTLLSKDRNKCCYETEFFPWWGYHNCCLWSKIFWKTVQLKMKVSARDGRKVAGWIVSKIFAVMRISNDPQSLAGEGMTVSEAANVQHVTLWRRVRCPAVWTLIITTKCLS